MPGSAMRPDADATTSLDARLEQLAPRVGLALGAQERRKLLAYLDLIQRWTQVYNLTAVRDPGEMFTHHLLDCLAVVEPMRRRVGLLVRPSVLDVGSGAGLPGAVLAILNPDWQVSCVDAVAKKVTFIRQVAAELALPNLHGVHGRVEANGTFGQKRFDLITSRAFASLADFTRLTRPLLTDHGCWAAMKAHLTPAERAELPSDVDVFHVEQLDVPELAAARCLVWMAPASANSGVSGDFAPPAIGDPPRQ
jgi:16S rRNA (guanine527-N7)-methyltransferase